jgi:phospholipid transport system substrate-binding protein
MDKQLHWHTAYKIKAPDTVRWFRPHLGMSSELVERAATTRVASILSALLVVFIITAANLANAQEPPDKMVQRISEEVMAIVRSDTAIQRGDPRKIRQVIEEKIMPNVDFDRSTALATGRYWRVATQEQKSQLQTEFRALLMHTYSGAMSQIHDQKINYEPYRADPADTDVEVFAKVLNTRGETVRFGYRLTKTPAGWKVYDVNVMGAWMGEVYRQTFTAEIQKSGIDGLIRMLADKNKRLAANPPQSKQR